MSNTDTIDSKTWQVAYSVEKYESDEALANGEAPYEVIEGKDNGLLNNGIARLLDLLIGAGGQAYNNANCRIGVGNGTTAFSAAHTDLQGASKYYMTMDATYPQRSAQTLTFKATFASGVAQFAWEEWGIDVGTVAGTTVVTPMLNRKVQSFGTKGATAWVFTVTITVA